MTQLEFNARLAKVVASAEDELKALLLDGARAVQKAKDTAEPVVLDIEGAKALVDGLKSSITLNAAAPQLADLVKIAKALESEVANVRAEATSFVAKVEAEVKSEVTQVETEVETVAADTKKLFSL